MKEVEILNALPGILRYEEIAREVQDTFDKILFQSVCSIRTLKELDHRKNNTAYQLTTIQ